MKKLAIVALLALSLFAFVVPEASAARFVRARRPVARRGLRGRRGLGIRLRRGIGVRRVGVGVGVGGVGVAVAPTIAVAPAVVVRRPILGAVRLAGRIARRAIGLRGFRGGLRGRGFRRIR